MIIIYDINLKNVIKSASSWSILYILTNNVSNIQAPSLLCGVRRVVLCKICKIATAFPAVCCDGVLGT